MLIIDLKGLLRGEPEIFAVRLFVRPSVPLYLDQFLDHQIYNIALKEAPKGFKRNPGWDIDGFRHRKFQNCFEGSAKGVQKKFSSGTTRI